MVSFAIKLYWPGMEEGSVRELVDKLKRDLASMDPTAIGFLGCTVSPRDEICFLRIEADAEWRVAELVKRLELGRPRISEMVDLHVE